MIDINKSKELHAKAQNFAGIAEDSEIALLIKIAKNSSLEDFQNFLDNQELPPVELNDTELDKRINTFLLWRIMKDSKTNKFAIQTMFGQTSY